MEMESPLQRVSRSSDMKSKFCLAIANVILELSFAVSSTSGARSCENAILRSIADNLHTSVKPNHSEALPHGYSEVYLQVNIFAGCSFVGEKSIVLIGNWTDARLNPQELRSFLSVNLLETGKGSGADDRAPPKKHYRIRESDLRNLPRPANNFIIFSRDKSLFELDLMELRNSVFWNRNGYFLIEAASLDNTCEEADAYLKAAWKFEMSSVIFICRDEKGRVHLYSYNPYSADAPKSWALHRILHQENGHPLALFKRIYIKTLDRGVCESLFPREIQSLNSYPIKLLQLTASRDLPYEFHRYGLRVTRRIVQTIWQKLNASVETRAFPTSERGAVDVAGVAHGLLRDLLAGKYDMQLNLDYERDFWRNAAYTFVETGICYLARKEFVLPGRSLLAMFSGRVWLLLAVVAAASAGALSLLLRISWLKVVVNMLRGILGVAMLDQPPHRLARLVYFILVFVFIVLNSCLQSKLLSLMTLPEFAERLNSPTDLINLRYELYGEARYEQYFYDTVFQYYMKRTESTNNCIVKLERSTRVACVCDCWASRSLKISNHYVQILADPHLAKYFVYIFRDDFPLKETFERVYSKMYESGIVDYIQRFYVKSGRRFFDNGDRTKAIPLRRIKFAFRFLTVGLLVSALAFAVELFIFKCTGKIREIPQICRK